MEVSGRSRHSSRAPWQPLLPSPGLPSASFLLFLGADVGRITPRAVGFHGHHDGYYASSRRRNSSSGAVFSGYHVLWPRAFEGALDWAISALHLRSAQRWPLFGLKKIVQVMKTLACCALAGF